MPIILYYLVLYTEYFVLSCPFCLGSIQHHSYSRRLATQYDIWSMMLIISIENPAGCKVSALLFDFDSRWFRLDPGCCLEPLLASITDPITNYSMLLFSVRSIVFPIVSTLSPLYRYSIPLHKSLMFTITWLYNINTTPLPVSDCSTVVPAF